MLLGSASICVATAAMADHSNNEKAPVADSVNATGVLPPSTAPGAPGVPAGEQEPTTATGSPVADEKAPVNEKKVNRFDAADVSQSRLLGVV